MGNLSQSSHPDLLVDVGDDAAVWSQPDGKVLISTADFFGPLVDDPYLWGQIAAANAASDVYAMGGKPLFALNLVCWPGSGLDGLGLDVLSEVLAGGAAIAERGGWNVVGGHTVTGPEPLYGQAVTGEATADSLLTLTGGQEGQAIVLTKPLGTGIITTAAMRRPAVDSQPGGDMHESYQAAITEMLRLNDTASQVAKDAGATAATDITGFGLLGHLKKTMRSQRRGSRNRCSFHPHPPRSNRASHPRLRPRRRPEKPRLCRRQPAKTCHHPVQRSRASRKPRNHQPP